MATGTTVEVTINEDGGVHVEVVGGKGPSCKKHVDVFKALGKTVSEGKKAEFHQAESNRVLAGNVVKNG